MTSRADLHHLADALIELGHRLKAQTDGKTTVEKAWDVSHSWAYGPLKPAAVGERGGGVADAEPEDRAKERIDDRRAAKVHDRLRHTLEALDTARRDTTVLLEVILPGQPRKLLLTDMTAVQLIADGWCPSCFRDKDNAFTPLAAGRYSDRCRPCGDYRAREGCDPPIEALRIMHKGKSIRQRVAVAMKSA